jgi:hypothetical protein
MAKHLSGHAKKWLMITGIGVLVIGGSYGGYVWYAKRHQQQPRVEVSEAARKQAAEYRLAGDEELSAQYVSLMQANKSTEAQQLFASKVTAESDAQKKADLYKQNIDLALSLQKTDAALEAANSLVALRASYDSYAQLASVYITRNDVPQQIVYLQKAIEALKQATDVPNKDSLMRLYQSQLDAANERLALKEKYGW